MENGHFWLESRKLGVKAGLLARRIRVNETVFPKHDNLRETLGADRFRAVKADRKALEPRFEGGIAPEKT